MLFLKKKDFIYSWETEREAETQAEEEAGSLRGAWCRTWSQDPRIMTWAKGRRSASDTQVPYLDLTLQPLFFINTTTNFLPSSA